MTPSETLEKSRTEALQRTRGVNYDAVSALEDAWDEAVNNGIDGGTVSVDEVFCACAQIIAATAIDDVPGSGEPDPFMALHQLAAFAHALICVELKRLAGETRH